MSPVSVLLVATDPLLRGVLQRALQRCEDVDIVGTETDGERALAMARRLAPDIAVLEVGARAFAAVEVCARLVRTKPPIGTRVLLLDDEPPLPRDQAVAAGAAGCLPATSSSAAICEAVHHLSVGGTIFHS
jgi:DNA-binding NarL/FixJ family response regulator